MEFFIFPNTSRGERMIVQSGKKKKIRQLKCQVKISRKKYEKN